MSQTLAALVQKEGSRLHLRLVPVTGEGLQGQAAYGNDPLAGTLSQHADRLTDRIEVLHIEGGQLGQPEP